jgi:hypothetical protein
MDDQRCADLVCSKSATLTGHRSLSEVARYTRAADQARLARQAMNIQLGAEREQDLSNQSTRVGKMGSK